MSAPPRYEAQRESARRAFRRVFVAGLARRMARSGVLCALASSLAGVSVSLKTFPAQHLRIVRGNANEKPLRIPGVAAGGAGGGGSGDSSGNVFSIT